MRPHDDDELMVRFLLQELSPEEHASIEKRYFDDASYFDSLLAAEDALIDGYVRGELPPDQRQRFEAVWLNSPERLRDVELARALLQTFSPSTRSTATRARESFVPAWLAKRLVPAAGIQLRARWALAAIVTLAVISLWLTIDNARTRRELAELRGTIAAQRQATPIETRANGARQRAAPLTTVAFSLAPGAVREASTGNRLLIQDGIDALSLRIDLPADEQHRSYRVVIRIPEGDQVWSQDLAPSRTGDGGWAIVPVVPAAVLPDGDYILTVNSLGAAGQLVVVTSRVFTMQRR